MDDSELVAVNAVVGQLIDVLSRPERDETVQELLASGFRAKIVVGS